MGLSNGTLFFQSVDVEIGIDRAEEINDALISYKVYKNIRTYVYKNTIVFLPKRDIGRHLSTVIRNN